MFIYLLTHFLCGACQSIAGPARGVFETWGYFAPFPPVMRKQPGGRAILISRRRPPTAPQTKTLNSWIQVAVEWRRGIHCDFLLVSVVGLICILLVYAELMIRCSNLWSLNCAQTTVRCFFAWPRFKLIFSSFM